MALPKTEDVQLDQQQIMTSRETISVIVAVNNQRDFLEQLNDDLHGMLKKHDQPFEILYVDDGSTDGTWPLLRNICDHSPSVRIMKLRTSFGESAVLEAAMERIKGDRVIFYSSRVRVNPNDLDAMLKKLDDDNDLVIGVRHPRRDSGLNQIVSRMFNKITSRVTEMKLRDVNSGVVVVRRQVLENVPFYGALNAFLPILAHRQGYRIAEEKVEQMSGHSAQSLYPKDYIRRFLDLISVMFLSKYSKKPLHFLGFFGAILTGAGLLIDLYLFFYRILGFGGIAGRPMLLLGTVFLVIGLQMIAIGLLGEMIIFTHARTIREYNIEEVIG